MVMFLVPGRLDPSPAPPEIATSVPEVRPRQSVTIDVTRSSQRPAELEAAACVELQLSRGVRLWVRSEDLQRDLGLTADRAGGPVQVPRALPLRQRSRDGESELAIQALKTFDIDIPGRSAEFIASRVERGMEAGGQLQQCSVSNAVAFNPLSQLDGRSPTLVFIHGTASSTDGSFGGLWNGPGGNRILRVENPGAHINALFKFYGGRVLALQHRTLTESPLRNAQALVQQLARVLPGGSELHMVSHSRGGVIGELLCRGMRTNGAPFDELDLRAFEERPQEQERLLEISRVLKEQQYRITRFVRVGCPAAGTTLADGRLDRYVSMLINIVGKMTTLSANPMYDALTNLLAAVLKERTDPASLPGLEAMMPVSPLSKILNRRDVTTAADLHVLGGDLSVTSVWSALKALATDFYYLQDHDLVVNTRSMLRGIPRAGGVKYWIDTGGEVSHFNYFRRGDTSSRVVDALAGTEQADEFRVLKVPPFEVGKDSYRKRADAPLPIVFVIPGCMGSHLSVSGRVWADGAEIASGRFGLLANGSAATPETLVGAYAPLIEALSANHEVIPFPYDWRLPAAENAKWLRSEIQSALPIAIARKQPIRLLAHSSGGLLLHALLASDEGASVWRKMCEHPGARAVLLGYPAGGSHQVAALLTTRSPLVQGMAAIDLTRSIIDLQQIFVGFQGLLELLPDRTVDGGDWFDEALWRDLHAADARSGTRAGWQLPAQDQLRLAGAARAQLRRVSIDASRVLYVAGTAASTPAAVRVDDDGSQELAVFGTSLGDGYGTWAASIPTSLLSQAYLASVDHAGLVASSETISAVADLLTSGRTARLRRAQPVMSLGADAAPTKLSARPLEMIPSDAELVTLALGGDLKELAAPSPEKVRVRVVHGDLSRASSPVLLGHYEQDVIVNAEAYLDRQLDGRLRELYLMRLYPGPIGTSVVVLDDMDRRTPGVHPGAIVVGLGVVGQLTPGSLQTTLEQGLTAYGAERTGHERRRRRASAEALETGGSISVPVTALLVGSGAAGVSLRDSVAATLRAVVGANQRLGRPVQQADGSKAERTLTAFVNALDLYDLFEDRAIEAARLLTEIAGSAEFRDVIAAAPFMVRGKEAQQRAAFNEKAGWWQRLRITEHDASMDPDRPSGTRVLKYEAFTERARIDAYTVPGQRKLADVFINDAMLTTAFDRTVGRTLFEMLMPNSLKEHAPDRRDTVLLLDTAAAGIPWELLEDGFQHNARPLAVEAGMIRQLVDPYGREQVTQAIARTALVIGNPPAGDARFPSLEGAEKEALTVAARLQAAEPAYEVQALIGAQATTPDVLKALHSSRGWQILHLATHGVFEFVPEKGANPITGAVLPGGAFLQPQDFNQLRYVPELVFLNCCHGGNTQADAPGTPTRYPQLAANLATQFIKMGSRAVIAAGWAVNDAAAQLFSDTFYSYMLAGQTFGDATRLARAEVYGRFPYFNTWGAYQCYGDPAFSLATTATESSVASMVSDRELWLFADSIVQRAKTADASETARLAVMLDSALTDANPEWLDDPRGLVALGTAFGELRRFDQAISLLRKARNAASGDMSLRALEQLANMQSRYAEQLWRDRDGATGDDLRSRVDDYFRDAERLFDALIRVSPTSERHSMLGGSYKRRAIVDDTATLRQESLVKMLEQYKHGYTAKLQAHEDDPWYPLSNAVVAELALSWQSADGSAESETSSVNRPSELLPQLRSLGNEMAKKEVTGFWELCFLADLALVESLSDGRLGQTALKQAEESYKRALKRGGSAREFDSVVTQIRFLLAMAEGSPQTDVHQTVTRALRDLVTALQ